MLTMSDRYLWNTNILCIIFFLECMLIWSDRYLWNTDHHYLSRKFLSECWHCRTLLPSLWWEIIFNPTHKNWICCTVNNCTSCPHWGSACERKGFYYSQMCWNTRFSICHLWLSTQLLSFQMTGGFKVNINYNISPTKEMGCDFLWYASS